jgi:hypothetical protein
MGNAEDGGTTIVRRCARCGASFGCGAQDSRGCWCALLPPLDTKSYLPEAGCLCPQCLQIAIDRAHQ